MLARLLWLSVGTFVIGTEMTVIAGILPEIASDMEVSVAVSGQLVTVFALVYAIGSPVLSTLLGGVDRRLLLVGTLVAFALANAVAASADTFSLLMVSRVLLALSAGLFIPNANAVAVALVPPEMRGRAVATVIGGLTVALAFGAPLGVLLAGYAGWRSVFAVIGAASVLGAIGLTLGLPRDLPRTMATLRQRIALTANPAVLRALLVTVFWSMAAFAVFTYIAAFLGSVGVTGPWISAALFTFGVSAAIGNAVGGNVVDRIGAPRTLAIALVGLAVALALVSLVAKLVVAPLSGNLILALAVPWGIALWIYYPAQASRLVQIAPEGAVVALSLNSSALFFGTALGAGLGGLVMTYGVPSDLGLVAGVCILVALGFLALSLRPAREAAPQPAE